MSAPRTTTAERVRATGAATPKVDLDVLVVGAGFSGLYALHRLRAMGLDAQVHDAADEVGGTWYWNQYPGARCDIPSTDYTYAFDAELEAEWTWSEKYATQPEILAYLQFVADRYDLRRDIVLGSRIEAATWDEHTSRWRTRTAAGVQVVSRYLVMATGCLSVPKTPDIPGLDTFAGDLYSTSAWPHDGVDFTGKHVAVVGTGSSGIQAIPHIARQAEQLTVFQRTACYSIPALNGPAPRRLTEALAADRDAYREAERWSRGGIPHQKTTLLAKDAPEQLRRERFEDAWASGEIFVLSDIFADQLIDETSNEIVAEMVREKIREVVADPAVAELLTPRGYPIATKRLCLDTDYHLTYNRPNVTLVDIRTQPITTVEPTGIRVAGEDVRQCDAIVLATGFDAMTGALGAIDLRGREGLALRDAWAAGATTYLGLMVAGFPNLFTVTGPGSPSVMSNMAVSIQQHVEWITDCLIRLAETGATSIEPTALAQASWTQHTADLAALTLHGRADSWYWGANVPGKPRVFLPYLGGVDAYRAICDEVLADDLLGFRLTGPSGTTCNDGIVRPLQPDVAVLVEQVAALGLPRYEDMTPAAAREFATASTAARPPGPGVGEVMDGTCPGGSGSLRYRAYRPATPGPHPAVAYFHGGGWLLGGVESDEPLCRDLCNRLDAVVVSFDYRHAPEAPFPAAVDDALAAVGWLAQHAGDLGALSGQVAVAGWSAGANLATVVTQLARDAGGPDITAQLLICPVTDADLTRPSFGENAEGHLLTTSLMRWFWDNYAAGVDRADPRMSPLRGDLAGLPPAVVVTADFDPLRDEGRAYAQSLDDAGVPVAAVRARGQNHMSVVMVGLIRSADAVRDEAAAALRPMLRREVMAPAGANAASG